MRVSPGVGAREESGVGAAAQSRKPEQTAATQAATSADSIKARIEKAILDAASRAI